MEIQELRDALGEDLYEKAQAALRDVEHLRVISTQDGKWIPKSRFDEARQAGREMQKTIDDMTGQMGDMQGKLEKAEARGRGFEEEIRALKKAAEEKEAKMLLLTEDVTGRDQQLEMLQKSILEKDGSIEALQKAVQEGEERMAAMVRDQQIRDAIRKSGARDSDLIFRLIDLSALQMDGGKLKGIQEQLDALRKSSPYLFGRDHPQRGGYAGGEEKKTEQKGTFNEVNAAIRAAFGR
ncbi:MAG: phage scaffolding protein [Clostridia bacterium]|nr:phage scaffolding protein [Clostridia bacterium]